MATLNLLKSLFITGIVFSIIGLTTVETPTGRGFVIFGIFAVIASAILRVIFYGKKKR